MNGRRRPAHRPREASSNPGAIDRSRGRAATSPEAAPASIGPRAKAPAPIEQALPGGRVRRGRGLAAADRRPSLPGGTAGDFRRALHPGRRDHPLPRRYQRFRTGARAGARHRKGLPATWRPRSCRYRPRHLEAHVAPWILASRRSSGIGRRMRLPATRLAGRRWMP